MSRWASGRASEKCISYISYKVKKSGKYYIGSTNNIERRLMEHNSGKTKSLKYLKPLRVVFKKGFSERLEAIKIEKKLKKLKSRKIVEKIVKDQRLILLGP